MVMKVRRIGVHVTFHCIRLIADLSTTAIGSKADIRPGDGINLDAAGS